MPVSARAPPRLARAAGATITQVLGYLVQHKKSYRRVDVCFDALVLTSRLAWKEPDRGFGRGGWIGGGRGWGIVAS